MDAWSNPWPPAPPTRPSRPLVAGAIVGTLLLWASAFVAIRAIGDTFGPGPMALLRLVAGSAALTVFVLARSVAGCRRGRTGAARR